MAKSIIDKYVKKSKVKKIPMPRKGNSWLANAMKSVGNTSLDILEEMMPSTVEFANASASVGKDVATSLMGIKNSDNTLKDTINKTYYVGLGKDILKNSLEDLKSGKLYNKERLESLQNQNDDFDFDDFDFGNEDFDSDIDDFSGDIETADGNSRASFTRKKNGNVDFTNIQVNADIGPDSTIVQATEYQTETTVNVGRAVIDNTRIQNRALITMLGQINNNLGSSLVSIGDNVATLATTVSETLSQHNSLSAKYFEDSLSVQKQILEHLQTKLTGSPGTSINTREFKEYKNIMDLIGTGGSIDFKGYLDLIKKQATNYVDSNMLLSQLKFMDQNREGFDMIAASPLQSILKNGIKSLIPNMMQKAITSFDEQLKETGVAALNQVSGLRRSDNPFLNAIGQIFGVQNKITLSKVDKGAYNKGAMSWTGVDHQALTNVIPTLLRKIYASVSGTQEVAFDYENGVWKKLRDIEKEQTSDRKNKETSQYGDYKSEFSEFINKTFAASPEEKKEFTDSFETFISKIVKDSSGGRTFRLGGRTGNKKHQNGEIVDDIRDLLGATSSDDSRVKAIRSFLEYLSQTNPAAVTRFFGSNVQEQRAILDSYYKEIQNDPVKYGTIYRDTGLKGSQATDSHLKFDEKDKNVVVGIKSGLASGVKDEYGRDQNYYLRQIFSTLTTGIYVVPISDISDKRTNNDPDASNEPNDNLTTIKSKLESNKKSLAYDKKSRKSKSDATKFSREKYTKKGLIDPTGDFSQEFLTQVASAEANADNTSSNNNQKKGIFGKLLDAIPEDSSAGKMLNRIRKMRSSTDEKGTSIFNRLNKALFSVVFGDPDGDKGMKSIFNKAIGFMKSQFTKFASFFDSKVLKPLDEALFGDNGLINKIKESQIGKKISEKFSNIKDKAGSFFLGEKTGPNGERSGGLFSETANALKDMGTHVKEGIIGKKGPDGKPLPLEQDDSVLGNMKKMFKGVTTNIKSALGIESSGETFGTKLSNTVDVMFNRIKDRASEWSDNLFGQKDENGKYINSVFNSEFASQFKEDMKGQKGYIAASASVGALASIFLPGGPIGGALVGAGLGIVKKSTGLQNALFGEIVDEKTGERAGGIISNEVQKFFKDHSGGMKLGATAGFLSSIGLLPSFFLPGGPIGGALIGTGVSIIKKSGAFDELLYGEGGSKDNPVGGLSSKLKEIFGKNKDFKTLKIDAGIGAGVGLLGSFFLPGGPIINALLGSAISVGTATDKFKNWFFGNPDDNGKRSGGIFGRFNNFMKDKIFTPLSTSVKLAQSHIMEFVQTNMVLPFKIAMTPLRKEAIHAKDVVKEKLTNLFDGIKKSVHERVISPIGDAVEKHFLNPMKTLFKNLFKGLGTLVGTLISAPFKMVGAAGRSADNKQRERLKNEYIEQNSGKGLKGFLKRTGMRLGLYDRDGIKTAQDANGPSYDTRLKEAQDVERKKREAERAAITNGYKPEKITNKKSKSSVSSSSSNKKSKDFEDNSSFNTRVKSSSGFDQSIRTKAPSKSDRKRMRTAYREAYYAGFSGQDLKDWVFDSVGKLGYKPNGNKNSTSNIKDTRIKSKSSRSSYIKDNTKTSTDDVYKPEKQKASKNNDSNTLLSKIQKDVSKISDSVYGQLNGVGSNVNKIYRLLLKKFGHKDEDIQGDNNKSYMGFFARLRTKLNDPIKAVKDIITAPFVKIADFVTSGISKVKNVSKSIIVSIKNVGGSLLKGLGYIAKGIAESAVELIKLPIDIVRTGLSVVRNIMPAIGEGLKTAVGVIGDGLKIAGSVVVDSVKTVGNVITEASSGIGKLLGGALSGLGSLLSGLGLIGKDVLKGAWKGIKFVGKTALTVASTPFKALGSLIGGKGGGILGKGPIHVIVDSGTLDKVKRVKRVEIVESIGSPSEGSTKVRKSGGSSKLPINLRFFSKNKDKVLGKTDIAINNLSKEDRKKYKNAYKEGVSKGLEGEELRQYVLNLVNGTTTRLGMISEKMKDAKGFIVDKFGSVKNLAKSKVNSIRDKLKNKSDRDRAKQVENGSRASVEARIAKQDKDNEESSFKSKILSLLGRTAESGEKHFKSFFDVFDLKKGLITAGLIAMAPLIFKFVKKLNLVNLAKDIINGIKTAFKEIGGLSGLFNNVKEEGENFNDVVKGEDTHYKVDENGNLVYDKNGNLKTETTKSSRLKEFFTDTKTRIDPNTGEWTNEKYWNQRSAAAGNYVAHKAIKTAKKVKRVYNGGKKVVNAIKSTGRGIKGNAKKAFDYVTLKSDKLANDYVHVDDAAKAVKSKTTTRVANAVKSGKKKLFDKVVGNSELLSKSYVYADDAAKAVKESGLAKSAAKNISKHAKNIGVKIANKAKDSKVLTFAIKMMNKALDFIFGKMSKLCAKYGVKISESKIGINVIKKLLTVSKLKPLTEKITKFIAGITTKTATSAGTLGLMEIGFIAYGALDGATNAGSLFEVKPKDVDGKMRAIATVFRGILNSSIGSWADLLSSIIYEIAGLNPLKFMATYVYNCISGDTDEKKLKKAQDKFTSDYEAYTKKEYDVYAKKETEAGRTPMSEKDFKASKLSTSRSDYNSKVNKSLGTRIFDGVKSVGKGIKKAGSTVVGGAKEVGKGIKTVVKAGKKAFTSVGSSITNGAKDGLDAAKAVGSGFAQITKNFYNKENSFLDFFKKDVNTLDETNMFHGLVSGILNVSKFVMFPKLMVFGILKKVGGTILKSISPVVEGAKNVGNNLITGAPTIFKNAIGGKIIDFFTYKVNGGDNEGISTVISNMILSTEKMALAPFALTSAAIRPIVKLISPVVEGAKNVGNNLITGAPTIFKNALDGKLIDFFTYSIQGEEGSGISTAISNVVLGVEKSMLTPFALTSAAIRPIVKLISPVVEGIKETGTNLIKGVPKIAKYAITGKVGNFFSYAINSNGESSISAHVANAVLGVEKSMLTPVALVTGGVRKIGEILTNPIKDVANFGSTAIKFVKKLNKYTDPTKDISGWNSELMGGDKDDVVNVVTSSIIKSIMWKYVSIVRTIRQSFDWVGDTVDKVKNTGDGIFGKIKSGGKWILDKFDDAATSFMNFARGGKNGGRPIYGKGGDDNYYSQNDPKYKNKKFIQNSQDTSVDNTMGESGCGPTAMAMVASKMTNKKYDPIQMARLAEAGGYTTSMGTSPSYFNNAANVLGIPSVAMSPSYKDMNNALNTGNSVILQGVKSGGNNSPFTSQGHYVVVNGVNNGKVMVSDPRGKEYSGIYNAKDVMGDATGMWTFGGGKGVRKRANILKKFIKGGKGGAVDNWISIVKAVKQAIAAQKPGYSMTNYITINVNGKSLRVRTDCSGFVSACLKYFGVLDEGTDLNSSILADRNNNYMKNTGFTGFSWPGWENLMEGDILAINGHTEIFAYNDGNKHYVYNCGSDSSVNNAEPCGAAHTKYSTVWRCDAENQYVGSKQISGTASGTNSTVTGTSSDSSSGGVSSLSELFSGAASAFSNSIMKGLGLSGDSGSDISNNDSTTGNTSINAINVQGSDNAEKIWNYFKSLGYSDAAVAAILGNAQQESNINPESGKDGGVAHGIFQWETGRFTALQNHANQMGKNWYTIEPQMSYLASELSNPEIAYFNKSATYGSDVGHGAAGKTNWEVAGTTKTSYEDWKQSTDVDTATRQFEAAVERASLPLMDKRIGYAKGFYDKYAGGKGGDGGHPISPMTESRDKIVSPSVSTMSSDSPKISDIIEKNIADNSMTSKETSQLLNTMIKYLSIIVDNTGDTSSELKDLNKKDFGTTNNYTTNNVSTNNVSESSKETKNNPNKGKPDRSGYNMAKRIAAGILT